MITSAPNARMDAASSMKPSILRAIQRGMSIESLAAKRAIFQKVVERHDAGHDGDRDATFAHLIDKVKVRIGVEEELRDRQVRAACALATKFFRSRFGVAALGWYSGIGRHLDGEIVAVALADETHQIGGVSEFTDRPMPLGRSPRSATMRLIPFDL